MSISSVGPAAATYTAVGPQSSTDESPAATPPAPAPSDTTRPSTTVTLSDRSVSEIVPAYLDKTKSMPMSVAAAPQLFAQADANHDNTLSLEEFTDQLKRVGVNSDAAKQLFDSINSSKGNKLSIDDFVNGVVATNAKGNGVFQDLLSSYTSDADGKFSVGAFDSFMAQGASVANQYWAEHPELQQR
jgi:Ca2+-binding EF-hand superfamily protein